MLRRLCCGLIGLLALSGSHAQELTLRTVQQASSIVKYDPDGSPQRPGICMEVLRAVERVDPGLHFSGLDQHVPLRRVERLLADGQMDAFFCLLRHIRDARLSDKVRLGRAAFQEEAQYLAVRSDLPAAAFERLTDALRRLERDGVLRQIAEKYR